MDLDPFGIGADIGCQQLFPYPFAQGLWATTPREQGGYPA